MKLFARRYCLPAVCRAFKLAMTRSQQSIAMARYCAHQIVEFQKNTTCLTGEKALARRPTTAQEFRYCRSTTATIAGLVIPHTATRSNCYWTTEANVSESEAEDIGTWWLRVLTGFASLASAHRTEASKYDKALVATVALPETITNTGLRSCLNRTTG